MFFLLKKKIERKMAKEIKFLIKRYCKVSLKKYKKSRKLFYIIITNTFV